MRRQLEREKRVLFFSVTMTLLSSILGISMGFLSRSQIVLFDGVYSLVSLALSLTTFYTAKFMSKNDWKRYPFGKAAAEPLAMIFNYTVLIFLGVQFIIENIGSLLEGGREVDPKLGVVYASITTGICSSTYAILRSLSKEKNSGLLLVEAQGWLYDTLVSVSVLITFVAMKLLDHVPDVRAHLHLIDPVVTILISLAFIRIAVKMIIEASKEILAFSERDELTKQLEKLVESIEEEYKLKESFVRVSKGRRIVWVEIDFVVDKGSLVKTVEDEDRVREIIYDALRKVKSDKWVTVSFTTKRKWAR